MKRGRKQKGSEPASPEYLAEVERLEEEVARLKRTHVSRGEVREALDAVATRLAAWWAGGDPDQTRQVIAATLGMSADRVPQALVEHPEAFGRGWVASMRDRLLGGQRSSAEDYALPRLPEVVAEMVEELWKMLLAGFRGDTCP